MSVPLQASKSRFVVGSHVWVEDPDEAWMDGLVEQINGDELVVNCTSGKKVIHCSTLLFVDYQIICDLRNKSLHNYLFKQI